MKRHSLYSAAALLLLLTLIASGCTPEAAPPASPSPVVYAEETVLVVGGQEVSEMEFNYQLNAVFDAYTYYWGTEIDWTTPIDGQPADQFFKNQATGSIVLYRLVDRYAAELNLSLTDEEQASIDETIAAAVEQAGGEDAFQTQLDEAGLSSELYRYIMTGPELYYKVFQHLYGDTGPNAPRDSEVNEYYYDRYLATRHIMLLLSDENGNTLSGDALAEKQARMDQIASEIASGADFDSLMEQNNEDLGLNGQTLCFGPNDMPEEYYNAASALGENETSEVLEILGTLCIIKRLPLEESYLNENFTIIREQYAAEAFDKLLAEKKADLAVETTARYDQIDVAALFETYKASR